MSTGLPFTALGQSFARLVVAAAVVAAASASLARADGTNWPVPKVTIYPGDRIDSSMLTERVYRSGYEPERGTLESANLVIGKIARRTLLPDQPIASIAVETPRLVTIGARVKIVFVESGVVITGLGIAQQAGSLGDMVQIRNLDSGLMIVGRVQKDGSILVSEG